jgi:hypothetical protein
MRYFKATLLVSLLATWLAGTKSGILFAQGARGPQEVDVKVDYTVARSEIVRFEDILSKVVASAFSSSPFALVQKPKGVYLPGYGVTFNFLVNVHRAVIDTPFGQIRNRNDATPELKKRIIEDLKDRLIRTLLENGESLKQVRKEDSISIVAFTEDLNFPDEPNQNKTIILTVVKKDFEDVARKDDRWKEFKQRMKIVEY